MMKPPTPEIGRVRPLALRSATLALLFLYDGPTPAKAQVVRLMDGVAIERAIDFGTKASDLAPYEIRVERRGAYHKLLPKIGGYTTPFLRVALAAYQAKKLYQPRFRVDQVTETMVRPVLEVYAASMPEEGLWGATAVIGNLQSIIITKRGKREPFIRPSETSPLPMIWRNLLGFAADGTGMSAIFPLEALSPDNEVHLIYNLKVSSFRCQDCQMLGAPLRK